MASPIVQADPAVKNAAGNASIVVECVTIPAGLVLVHLALDVEIGLRDAWKS